MAPASRICSECSQPLASRSVTSKTCGNACRLKRSRRLRRANARIEELEQETPGAAATAAQLVRTEGYDVIKRVMHDELQPIVREALTEDVLQAVHQMLGLTKRAVELLEEDLESDDATVRQRAYTLVTKYTIGHPALIQPKDTDAGGQLVVNFNLPRPDVPSPGTEDIDVEEAEELVTCDMCTEEKPASEYVAGSTRCAACHEQWKQTVLEKFGA